MKYTISKGKEKQSNIQEKKLLCLYYYSNGKKKSSQENGTISCFILFKTPVIS